MKYGDRHRRFLQKIMHAGIISDEEAQIAVKKIFDYDNSVLFHVAFINQKLEPLGMAIKSGCCELTGNKFWMLTSTTDDMVTQFQTEFSQGQLEFIRKLFGEIITSDEGCITSKTTLNLCGSMESNFTKESAEDLLKHMVQHKWMDLKDGCYFIGVRGIIELMPYFRKTYQEGFNNCPLCKQSVFHGRRCIGCMVVAHLYCLANFARVQKSLKCSNCNKSISTDNLPVAKDHAVVIDNSFVVPESVTNKKQRVTRSGSQQ